MTAPNSRTAIALVPEWQRRALDSSYYPGSIADCFDLIDRLRMQIHELTTAPDSERHGLTKCQYAIYSLLRNRAGHIVSKEQILAAYVEPNEYRRSNLIHVHINAIRKKLPEGERIETVWAVGFRWERVQSCK